VCSLNKDPKYFYVFHMHNKPLRIPVSGREKRDLSTTTNLKKN